MSAFDRSNPIIYLAIGIWLDNFIVHTHILD
jgi:hypothetical protein